MEGLVKQVRTAGDVAADRVLERPRFPADPLGIKSAAEHGRLHLIGEAARIVNEEGVFEAQGADLGVQTGLGVHHLFQRPAGSLRSALVADEDVVQPTEGRSHIRSPARAVGGRCQRVVEQLARFPECVVAAHARGGGNGAHGGLQWTRSVRR